MSKWYDLEKLNGSGRGIYSQGHEDIVLQYIFDNIGTTSKYCVEIGVGKWEHSPNTRHFREQGWEGCGFEVKMKFNPEKIRAKYNIYKDAVSLDNVNDLFSKCKSALHR